MSRLTPGKCSVADCLATEVIDCIRCHKRDWCYNHMEPGKFTPLYCEPCRVIRSNANPYLVIKKGMTISDIIKNMSEDHDELSLMLFYEKSRAHARAEKIGGTVVQLSYED